MHFYTRLSFLYFALFISVQVFTDETPLPKTPNQIRVNRRDFGILATLSPCAGNAWCDENHDYEVLLDTDLLSVGRVSFRFTNKLLPYLSLVTLVSYDNTYISTLWQIRNSLTQNTKIMPWKNWSIQAGLGLKFRLSEWFLKTSVFIEPSFQAGYSQSTVPVICKIRSLRLLPMVAIGTDTVFDNGFILSARLASGFALDCPSVLAGTSWQFSPSVGVGYAW